MAVFLNGLFLSLIKHIFTATFSLKMFCLSCLFIFPFILTRYYCSLIIIVFTVDEVITTELDGKLFHKFHKCAENIDVIFLLCFHHLIEQEKNNMYFLRNYDLQEIWCNFKHLIRTYNPLKRHSKLTSCLWHWYDVIPTVVENRYNRDSSVREDVGWCSLIVFINLLEDKCINQYWLKRKSSFPRCFAPIFTIFCASMITKRKEILIILRGGFHLAA